MANRKQYFYFIDTHAAGEKISVLEKATNAVTKNGWTSSFKTVGTAGTDILKVRGIFTDANLIVGDTTSSYSNIPSRFHEHIVNKAIAIGYKDPRHMEIQNAQYFDAEYEKGIKKAKKFARSNYITTGRIVPQDF
jgi:hypothetical protein